MPHFKNTFSKIKVTKILTNTVISIAVCEARKRNLFSVGRTLIFAMTLYIWNIVEYHKLSLQKNGHSIVQ